MKIKKILSLFLVISVILSLFYGCAKIDTDLTIENLSVQELDYTNKSYLFINFEYNSDIEKYEFKYDKGSDSSHSNGSKTYNVYDLSVDSENKTVSFYCEKPNDLNLLSVTPYSSKEKGQDVNIYDSSDTEVATINSDSDEIENAEDINIVKISLYEDLPENVIYTSKLYHINTEEHNDRGIVFSVEQRKNTYYEIKFGTDTSNSARYSEIEKLENLNFSLTYPTNYDQILIRAVQENEDETYYSDWQMIFSTYSLSDQKCTLIEKSEWNKLVKTFPQLDYDKSTD